MARLEPSDWKKRSHYVTSAHRYTASLERVGGGEWGVQSRGTVAIQERLFLFEMDSPAALVERMENITPRFNRVRVGRARGSA